MKVSLNIRQDSKYLAKADEIKCKYKDRKGVFNLIEKYPEATFNIDCFDISIDWEELKELNYLTKDKLLLGVYLVKDAKKAKEMGIKFYFNYPITSFYQLNALKELDPAYIILGAPLFFQMDRIAEYGIKVRAVPNVSYSDTLPRKSGVHGTWIRPEDLEWYEEYIDLIEFEDCDITREQALYRLYIEKKEWKGDVKDLITNFKIDALNRIVESTRLKTRLNCGQRCEMPDGNCRICDATFSLANYEKVKSFAEHFNKI